MLKLEPALWPVSIGMKHAPEPAALHPRQARGGGPAEGVWTRPRGREWASTGDHRARQGSFPGRRREAAHRLACGERSAGSRRAGGKSAAITSRRQLDDVIAGHAATLMNNGQACGQDRHPQPARATKTWSTGWERSARSRSRRPRHGTEIGPLVAERRGTGWGLPASVEQGARITVGGGRRAASTRAGTRARSPRQELDDHRQGEISARCWRSSRTTMSTTHGRGQRLAVRDVRIVWGSDVEQAAGIAAGSAPAHRR